MYLLLPHINIHNANAIASPLTWGFPSMTAFLGAAHALARKLSNFGDIEFKQVGVVCHHFNPQVYKVEGKSEYQFCLTRYPLDKEGKTPSIIEEGRMHLEVSLIIEVGNAKGLDQYERADFVNALLALLPTIRIVGGSVYLSSNPRHQVLFEDWPLDASEHKKLLRKLLPGYALISQHQRLAEYHQQLQQTNPQATQVEALIDMCSLRSRYVAQDDLDHSGWQVIPKGKGWLVPISVGYATISALYPAGVMKGCRDRQVPSAFVEAVHSLGEWRSPHRLKKLDELLWHYHTTDNGLYLCVNQ